MKKKAQVIMLPTDKVDDVVMKWRDGKIRNHHLYIVTDDEIKEGDWALSMEEVTKDNPIKGVYPYKVTDVEQVHWDDKKIIATTDPELIISCKGCDIDNIDGIPLHQSGCRESAVKIPQPSKAFIEKYCKVGGIDEVDVEYGLFHDGNFKNDGETHSFEPINRPKVDSHNTITIHPIKDSWSREEVVSLLQNMGGNAMLPPEEVDQWIKENL